MVLYGRITEVEYQLVAEIIFFAIGETDHPVFMFFIKFTFWIYHFRFDPDTELDSLFLCFGSQLTDAVRQFVGGFRPVAQTLMITAARVFIGKPSVIQQEHVYT